MKKINVEMEIDPEKAFEILLESLDIKLKEDVDQSSFVVENNEIVVKDYDDRGELYLALYHLATKIFMNTSFRSYFRNPNTLMGKLYPNKEIEQLKEENTKLKEAIKNAKEDIKYHCYYWSDTEYGDGLELALDRLDEYTKELI